MIKFYICSACGNLIEMITDSGIVPVCCGSDMEELLPGTTDGAREKHVPVCKISSSDSDETKSPACTRMIFVKVGSEPHPMTPGHAIEWIAVCTNTGVYRRMLDRSGPAETCFCLSENEQVKAVYAYCNLHGLWLHAIH